MSRTVKIGTAAVLVAIVALALALTGCTGNATTITTATVSKQTLAVTVAASGKVTAGTRADVYPPVAGTLDEVYVKDGQTVKAGQRLAVLDRGPLRLAVKQAQAGVEQAESSLATINQTTPSCADLKAANAAVDAAQAQYDNAVTAYDYAKDPPGGLPSNPTSIAIAAANKKQARAGLLSAKATVVKVKRGQNVGEQRQAANAAVASAEAALSVANANLKNATLTAPVDGVVFFNPTGVTEADGKVPLPSAGSGVSPAAAPFSVANLDASTFTAEVDEADVDRVKLGMAADVTLDAFPGQTFKTTVVRINPAAQPTATGGTIFQVELALTDTGKSILLGMKGDATIQVSSIQGTLTIPVEALFNENGKNYVYVVKDNKIKQTFVTVGATTDTNVEILKGLSEGTVVALAGPTYTDGMSVRVK